MKRQWASILLPFLLFSIQHAHASTSFSQELEAELQSGAAGGLAAFFDEFVGSWSGSGTVASVGHAQASAYTLDFKIAQISENSYERSATAFLPGGGIQTTLLDFELAGSTLRLGPPGETPEQAFVLESTPETLSFAIRKPADGRTYDLLYRWRLAGDRLVEDVEMDYEGEKVSENHFILTR